MTTRAVTPERQEELRRAEVRRTVSSLRLGEWLGRDGVVRRGHPLDPDDFARMTRPRLRGPDCVVCGRSLWVAVTRASAGRDRSRVEVYEDRLLCVACGHERADDREEIRDE